MIRVFRVLPVCLPLVAGCDSPSMAFRHLPAKRAEVGGSVFSVRHTAYEAEAIRVNVEPGARRRAILIRAAAAIETASGCAVLPATVAGDTNIVTADLSCGGAPETLRPVRPLGLDCVGYENGGRFDTGLIDISCDFVRR